MRNVLYAMFLAIVSWMVFGSMNELTLAHEENGCCGDGTCGKSKFTGMIWWANLMIAILATVVALQRRCQDDSPGPHASPNPLPPNVK